MVGCAASQYPNRAAVVMKINETEGHICMGAGEVKPGDRVVLYEHNCERSPGNPKRFPESCGKVKVGQGEVLRSLNEHYSVIRVESGVPFKEGTTVEKL